MLPWQPIYWQKWAKITYPLHLSLCNSDTEWAIAISMCVLTAQMMPLNRVEISWNWSSNFRVDRAYLWTRDTTRPKNWCIRTYWTDFRNLFTTWKRSMCRWLICTSFFNFSRTLSWQSNNVAKMLSTSTDTTCIRCTSAISWSSCAR